MARPAGTNRRRRRSLDRGEAQLSRMDPLTLLSAECLAQIVPSLQIVKIRAIISKTRLGCMLQKRYMQILSFTHFSQRIEF